MASQKGHPLMRRVNSPRGGLPVVMGLQFHQCLWNSTGTTHHTQGTRLPVSDCCEWKHRVCPKSVRCEVDTACVMYTSGNWELCKKLGIRTSTKRTSEQSEGLSSVPWSHMRRWILSNNDQTPQRLHSSILKFTPRPVTGVPETIIKEISDSPKPPRKYSSTGLCISCFPGMTTALSELAELYLLLQKSDVCHSVNWTISTRPVRILPNLATTPLPPKPTRPKHIYPKLSTSECFHRALNAFTVAK